MRRQSIATQWMTRSYSAVAVFLIIIDIASFFLIQSYYYTSVRQYMETQVNITAGVIERFYEESGTDYADEIRTSVEQFEKKDHAELMAINKSGDVYLSSSGFSPAKNYYMPDYTESKNSPDNIGSFVGRLESGERFMALTVFHAASGNALRIVTSLDRVDGAIIFTTLAITGASFGILLILFIIGMYFVRSIANPIVQVSKTARKLATGDFSVRIPVNRNDELGEMCGVFNYMADELQNSESLKNEFISSVSHELRTPLTAIKGWSETLLEIDDKETQKKGVGIISKETERLTQMVEELLDFSRIQNGKFPLNMDNMDIIAELGDAVLMYGERAKAEGITLCFEDTDAVAVVNGDKNRLRQVFINIIDNAIKYGKRGGRTDVSVEVSGGDAIIAIKDDGCGISAADLPKVKEKFYKANNTVRGSGIGLAVADEIIRLHGGTLDIKSELNKGTTVTITLPTAKKQ